LFDEFSPRTLRYLRGLIGDSADDAQQEVWLAVFRSLHDLSNPSAFRTWLYRTTRHRAIDFLRRQRREHELFEETAPEIIESAEAADTRDEPVVDEQILALMTLLPPPQRDVLLLRYRDELSYADIASVVGCPIGTVRTRLHHSKRKLSELLQKGPI